MMARNYKRKLGSRNYRTSFTQETLEGAIRLVKSKEMKVFSASKQFKIPYGALYAKSRPNYSNTRQPGRPRVLSEEEEGQILEIINQLTDWKFPLSEHDIQEMVHNYLNRLGKITMFKDNLPGYDWVNSFKNRHNLTRRLVGNANQVELKLITK